MSNPGQYRDFNKKANDLVTKVFPKKVSENQWGLDWSLEPTNYFKSSGKLTTTGGKTVGEATVEVAFEDFGVDFKETFKTDKPTLEASWAVGDKIPIDGVSAKLHLDATDSTECVGLGVSYEHEYVTLNGRVHFPLTTALFDFVNEEALADQPIKVDVDFVATHPDFAMFIGGMVNVSVPKEGDRSVDKAQAGLAWREGNLDAFLGYAQEVKDGEEQRKLTSTVRSTPGDTSYVVGVDYDLGEGKASGRFAMEFPLADGAKVKAKLDTSRTAGLAYSNKVSDSTTVSFGTLMAIKNEEGKTATSVDSSFAFNLKFTA